MREIKFRAWDKKEKRWYDWDSGVCNFEKDKHIDIAVFDLEDNFELMQFTGLKDKNGKEIFEGDIVKGIWGKNEADVFEVFWEDTGFWGKGKEGDYAFSDYHTLEVIGNKFENPELLK